MIQSERGSAFKGLMFFVALIAVIVMGVAYTFGYVVPPGKMGVREVVLGFKFGPKQGFSEEALPPGYHWSIPFYSSIHLIPQTMQVLTLLRQGGDNVEERGALEIQTEDGSSVFIDVSILYRYAEKPQDGSGGPKDLLTKLKVDPERWVNQIEQDASNRLKFRLGALTTSEFYNPKLRQKMLDDAFKDIHERVKPYGILVEGILLRRYRYREEIDNAIFQKNLQEQEKSLNSAKSSLAAASALLKEVAAAEDAKIKTLQVEGENKVRVIRSEGELYRTKKNAEGDLLVAQARAEVDKLRASALATSKGASIYVGRELAPVVASLKGGTVSNIDPYDLDAWLKRLGVQE
jgi:regulator of protease activity HflC (stomatin/prohibitin superfamily)